MDTLEEESYNEAHGTSASSCVARCDPSTVVQGTSMQLFTISEIPTKTLHKVGTGTEIKSACRHVLRRTFKVVPEMHIVN